MPVRPACSLLLLLAAGATHASAECARLVCSGIRNCAAGTVAPGPGDDATAGTVGAAGGVVVAVVVPAIGETTTGLEGAAVAAGMSGLRGTRKCSSGGVVGLWSMSFITA